MTAPQFPVARSSRPSARTAQDAARNYDALLAAAREAFAENGADASLEDIARRAGRGHRHALPELPDPPAPLRERLRDEVDALCQAAEEVAELEPWEALTSWLRRFVGLQSPSGRSARRWTASRRSSRPAASRCTRPAARSSSGRRQAGAGPRRHRLRRPAAPGRRHHRDQLPRRRPARPRPGGRPGRGPRRALSRGAPGLTPPGTEHGSPGQCAATSSRSLPVAIPPGAAHGGDADEDHGRHTGDGEGCEAPVAVARGEKPAAEPRTEDGPEAAHTRGPADRGRAIVRVGADRDRRVDHRLGTVEEDAREEDHDHRHGHVHVDARTGRHRRR